VLYDIENDIGSFNLFVAQQTYARLYAKAFFVDCNHFAAPYLPSQTDTGIVSSAISVSRTYRSESSAVGPSSTPSPKPTPSPTPATSSMASYSTWKFKCAPGFAEAPCVGIQRSYVKVRVAAASSLPGTPSPSPTESYQATNSITFIPTMNVLWLSDNELSSKHRGQSEYGVPLLSVAAAGLYLATRQYMETTSISQTSPLSTGGSVTTSTSKQGNNSALPFGVALAGQSLSSISNVTLGGTNVTRVLKSAAAAVASELREQIKATCPLSSTTSPPTPAPASLASPQSLCDFFHTAGSN
jgi:hypothetical protein